MEIKVRCKSIGDTQQVSEKFKKRDLIVIEESNPNYPQVLQFQATQDKVNLLDELREGDEVTIHFNLNGREFTKDGKTSVFNSLNIWKLDINKNSSGDTKPQYQAPLDVSNPNEDLDELPF